MRPQLIGGPEPTGVDDPLHGLPPLDDDDLARLEGAGRKEMEPTK